MIRVELPHHLRVLANVNSEVTLKVAEPVTLRRVLDALEEQYPVLRGTIRDHDTKKRRPFLRFFACQEDLSHDSPDNPLPAEVALGKEPLLVIGAIAGGRIERPFAPKPLRKASMQKIKPFLWFNDNAEEAVEFYLSVFPNAKRGAALRASEGGPNPAGSVLTVAFTIGEIGFVALNGGPHYQFTPAISFVIPCETQTEIDAMWAKLAAGGQEMQCGWLTDKFGVCWQVVPANIGELLQGRDAEGGKRAMAAMMQMVKLDIPALKRAGGLA
ncbi:MAG TPA: VOC family protein [Acidobacteriaceae bacterium]|jgi:predicted 3-demethylubiquinone-9 3-methyltransferase (glyoxalase superfamily)